MAQHIILGSLLQKQNHGEVSPSKQVRKLKAQLSDKIFQLKKLQEDYAEKKAHFMLQFNQQKAHLNLTIRQLKQKMIEQNQHWANKVDQIRKLNQQKINQNNQEWLKRIDIEVKHKMQKITNKYESQIIQLSANIANLNNKLKQNQTQYDKTLNKLKQCHKNNLSQINSAKQLQIEQIIKKMSHDEQMKINAIMYIKSNEQKEHVNTKNILNKKEKDYQQKINYLQTRIFELKQQIWNFTQQNQKLNFKVRQQSNQIEKLTENLAINVKMTTKQFEQKVEKIQQDWRNNMNTLNERWKAEYKKVQGAYEKVSHNCREKQKIWEERGQKVLDLYEKRNAREEDVKLIEQLEVQLIRKQFELQRQKQELKSCKLQLDNMDDIYKRIFNSVQKNTRNSHSFHLKRVKLPGIINRSTHPIKALDYFC